MQNVIIWEGYEKKMTELLQKTLKDTSEVEIVCDEGTVTVKRTILTEYSEKFKEWTKRLSPGNVRVGVPHLKYSAMSNLGKLWLDGKVTLGEKDEKDLFELGRELKVCGFWCPTAEVGAVVAVGKAPGNDERQLADNLTVASDDGGQMKELQIDGAPGNWALVVKNNENSKFTSNKSTT